MCLTMSKLSTFIRNCQLFMAKVIRSHPVLFLWYSSVINVGDVCLELALKCWMMPIGITATDRDAKRNYF